MSFEDMNCCPILIVTVAITNLGIMIFTIQVAKINPDEYRVIHYQFRVKMPLLPSDLWNN